MLVRTPPSPFSNGYLPDACEGNAVRGTHACMHAAIAGQQSAQIANARACPFAAKHWNRRCCCGHSRRRQAGRQAGSVRRPCRNQGHLAEGCCRCALVEVIIRKAVLEQRNARKGHAIPCDLMNMILAHRRW